MHVNIHKEKAWATNKDPKESGQAIPECEGLYKIVSNQARCDGPYRKGFGIVLFEKIDYKTVCNICTFYSLLV